MVANDPIAFRIWLTTTNFHAGEKQEEEDANEEER